MAFFNFLSLLLPLSVERAHQLSLPTISPRILTHPLYFSKSHYDVIQVGLFCTHAGSNKAQVYYSSVIEILPMTKVDYYLICFLKCLPCEQEDLPSHPDLKSQHVSKDVASCDPNPIPTECRALREMYQPGREVYQPFFGVRMLERVDQSLKLNVNMLVV